MLYGTIDRDGKIVRTMAHSGKFSVRKIEKGHYELDLHDRLMSRPVLNVAVFIPPGSTNTTAVATYGWPEGNAANRIRVHVKKNNSNSTREDEGFSFVARCGMKRVFNGGGNPLWLFPKVRSFDHLLGGLLKRSSSIVLEAELPGLEPERIVVDAGTELTAIGGELKIALRWSNVQDEDRPGQTWELTGWTFDDRNKAVGTPWGQETLTYGGSSIDVPCLTLSLGSKDGPISNPLIFAIKGKPQGFGVGQGTIISVRPIVRLTRGAPRGQVITTPVLGGP